MVLVNTLANVLPINGITTGEISDSFPVSFNLWCQFYKLNGAREK